MRLMDVEKLIAARIGPRKFEYRGFGCMYSGLMPYQDCTKLVGRFTAHSLHPGPVITRRRVEGEDGVTQLLSCTQRGVGANLYVGLDKGFGEFNRGEVIPWGPEPLYMEDLCIEGTEKIIKAAVDAKVKLLSMIDEIIGSYWGSEAPTYA